jgi:hypothetical protein
MLPLRLGGTALMGRKTVSVAIVSLVTEIVNSQLVPSELLWSP